MIVQVEAPHGTSLPRMRAIAGQAVDEIGSLEGIDDVTAQIGRAAISDQVVDVNQAEIWVKLGPDAEYDAAVDSIEDAMSDYTDVATEVVTYSDQRVTDLLQQPGDDIAVRLYGTDADVLDAKADEVAQAMGDVDGVRDVAVGTAPQEPTVEVQVDLDRAEALGIKPGDVRRAAASMLGGITVGNLFQEQKVFDVVVWGAPQIRESVEDIEQLLIETPDGRYLRLADVADVDIVPDDAVIRHESASRFVEVTADVDGRSVGDVADEVDALIKEIEFPLDHHAELMGLQQERQDARGELIAVIVAAAIMMFLLLQAAFRSRSLALVAFAAIPVALSGAAVATLVGGGEITLGSIAGLLAVLGVATRGTVVMMVGLLHLQRSAGCR